MSRVHGIRTPSPATGGHQQRDGADAGGGQRLSGRYPPSVNRAVDERLTKHNIHRDVVIIPGASLWLSGCWHSAFGHGWWRPRGSCPADVSPGPHRWNTFLGVGLLDRSLVAGRQGPPSAVAAVRRRGKAVQPRGKYKASAAPCRSHSGEETPRPGSLFAAERRQRESQLPPVCDSRSGSSIY